MGNGMACAFERRQAHAVGVPAEGTRGAPTACSAVLGGRKQAMSLGSELKEPQMTPRDDPGLSRNGTEKRPPETADCHANPPIKDAAAKQGTRAPRAGCCFLGSLLPFLHRLGRPGRRQQATQALKARNPVFFLNLQTYRTGTYII